MTTKEIFIKEVAQHVLEIHRDDGVFRHIRVRQPGTMCIHFDLITWPGHLCYTGDMGTYVFTRVNDMFDFFRKDKAYANKGDVLDHIDRRYWAEKIIASDSNDGVREFDKEAFQREISRQRRRLLVEHTKDQPKDVRQVLWDDLQGVIDSADEGEYRAITSVQDWYFTMEDGTVRGGMSTISIDTSDFPTCKTYTQRFLWCCYALRWGIDLYDKAKNDTTNSCTG